MPLLINLRHLERGPQHFAGEIPVNDLDLEGVDELITLKEPLKYDLEVQKMEQSILAQGRLELTLHCECVRCLKPFAYALKVEDWACLLPLEGDEKIEVTNDSVDLTPAIREDILLGFPQHPLCSAECAGLPKKPSGKSKKIVGDGRAKESSPAWTALNKLKF
jgi:uncharacterized protein